MKGQLLLLGLATLVATTTATAQPVFNPANGHYYELVSVSREWDAARGQADTMTAYGMPGHLVTISDAAENQFVSGMPGVAQLYPWIGAFQPTGSSEPSGGWRWVTDEPFVYTNWNPSEPNNSGGAENWAQLWQQNSQGRTWNDASGRNTFIVEYEPAQTVPEAASTLALMGMGLMGLMGVRCFKKF